MKHLKYSNTLVMAMIVCGYVILILADIFLHFNIMYLLAPYVLLTLIITSYTKRRSTRFNKYYLGFEVDQNSRGHILKFFIFANNTKQNQHPVIETVKYSQYQTLASLDIDQLRKLMNSLGYFVIAPKFVSVLNQLVVNRVATEGSTGPIIISNAYYDDLIIEYNKFKAAVINTVKQNLEYLVDQNSSKQLKHNLKKLRPLFLPK